MIKPVPTTSKPTPLISDISGIKSLRKTKSFK